MQFRLDEDDRRSNIRVDFKAPVQITFPESSQVVKGILINLSMSGMYVEMDDDTRYNDSGNQENCTAELLFTGKGSKLLIHDLQSTVARIHGNRIALEFDKPMEWFLLFCVYLDKQIQEN